MNYFDWNQYLYELQNISNQQQQQLRELQERVFQLETMVQQSNSHMVDKVEYHFDQLKIERLDGTLHIGLSPNDLANIDDLGLGNANQPVSVGIGNQNANPGANSPSHSVMADLTHFLHQEGPQMIQELANEFNSPVDAAFQSMLIQDMEKQLPQRIAYYHNEAKQNRNFQTNDELHQFIIEQIKNEVHHSLRKYMQGNTDKGE